MAFGHHVNRYKHKSARPSIANCIASAATEVTRLGFTMTAAAVFVGGPRVRKITLKPAEQVELKKYIQKTGMQVIAHSVYVAPPWEGKKAHIDYIITELEVCQAAGIQGLVVHLPKKPQSAVVEHLGALFTHLAPDVCIYLETPATTPRESYYDTPAKLISLFAALKERYPRQRIGLCLDTAHLWTNGVDLSGREAAEKWLAELEAGYTGNVMIHGNDSKREKGKGPDSHDCLLRGRMWGKFREGPNASGLAAFVSFAMRKKCPFILERAPAESLASDYTVLYQIVRGLEGESKKCGNCGGAEIVGGAEIAVGAEIATGAETASGTGGAETATGASGAETEEALLAELMNWGA